MSLFRSILSMIKPHNDKTFWALRSWSIIHHHPHRRILGSDQAKHHIPVTCILDLTLHQISIYIWNIISKFAIGSSGCCRVLGSAMCFGDYVLTIGFQWFNYGWFRDWWLSIQWLVNVMVVLQWWLILSFNVVDGSNMKIGWNVAFRLWCCDLGVSSLKLYETWSLEEKRRS